LDFINISKFEIKQLILIALIKDACSSLKHAFMYQHWVDAAHIRPVLGRGHSAVTDRSRGERKLVHKRFFFLNE